LIAPHRGFEFEEFFMASVKIQKKILHKYGL